MRAIESLTPPIATMCQKYKYVAQKFTGTIGSGCTVQLPFEDTVGTAESSHHLNAVRATSVDRRWIPSLTKRNGDLMSDTFVQFSASAAGSVRPCLVMKS